MKKIIFYKHEKYGDRLADSTDDKYILLLYFIQDQYLPRISRVIEDLTSIQNEEKVFEEIQDSRAAWSFGNASGEFKCDKDTAYFLSEGYSSYESVEMPLKEVIDLLKEYKAFLES